MSIEIKDDREHVANAVQTVLGSWTGIIGWLVAFGALAYEFDAAIVLFLGAGFMVFCMGAQGYAASVKRKAEWDAAGENREIVKLAFEAAVRKHFVADGHPMEIAQMMGQASMVGVSQGELQEIVNRVHESVHPDCFDEEQRAADDSAADDDDA